LNALARKNSPWTLELLEAMGPSFDLIETVTLMQMRIAMFVRTGLRHVIKHTVGDRVGTGIADKVGNKGAVAISVLIEDTTICVISTHLAAHEGEKNRRERKRDIVRILRHLQKGTWSPLVHKFDHIFWMGDMNGRIDPYFTHPEADTWPFEEKWEFAMRLVKQNALGELLANDELRRSILNRDVLATFREGKINFGPTFKVKRVSGMEYHETRIPSYCDRVLWCSLPRSRKYLKQLQYESFPSVSTSDHKPVNAMFSIEVPDAAPPSLPFHAAGLRTTITICKIRAVGTHRE